MEASFRGYNEILSILLHKKARTDIVNKVSCCKDVGCGMQNFNQIHLMSDMNHFVLNLFCIIYSFNVMFLRVGSAINLFDSQEGKTAADIAKTPITRGLIKAADGEYY